MALLKKEHWQTQAFNDHLLAHELTPFEWGQNDCCLSAANAILATTGVDIADDFRGKYSTEAGAFMLIKAVTDGETVSDAVAHCAAKHGLIEHEYPLMAKRGDLVVIANGDNLICGIVHLNGRHVVSVTEKGLVRLPISKVVRSWAV